jgi:hypothetical protein
VAFVVSLSVPAGLFLALGPVAYAKPANSGGGTVEEAKAERGGYRRGDGA